MKLVRVSVVVTTLALAGLGGTSEVATGRSAACAVAIARQLLAGTAGTAAACPAR
jgi:hypothetical protein